MPINWCGEGAGDGFRVCSLRMSQDLTLPTMAMDATAGFRCVGSLDLWCECIKRRAQGDVGGERRGCCERPEAAIGRGVERCRAPGPSGSRGTHRAASPLPCCQVVSLTFGKFDLEPDTYCRYDSVSVFNGAVSDDSKRLGKFCGDTVPG